MERAYFDIPFELTNPFDKRIAETFLLFDRNSVNMIDEKDVGAVLRSLGCVPSEADVKEIVKKTEFPDHPGNIHLTKFIPCLKSCLVQNKMKPCEPEELLKAFKLFDPEDKGFIHSDLFKKIFGSDPSGEELSEEEYSEMIKSAVDPEDNRVYYESYIRTLIYEPQDSIYALAENSVHV